MRLPFAPLVVDGGSGSCFHDVEGRSFLDLHSMACILNTGYSHPRVVDAVREQASRLLHVNSAYALHEGLLELAERLAQLAPGKEQRRVAFGLSGSDANDGALKLVRAATGRSRILAYRGSYHGNTYGALSLSGVTHNMRRGFGPELPGVYHIGFPDVYRMPGSPAEVAEACLDEIRTAFDTVMPPDEVAAVFLEPIQGDAGILVPPQEYIDGLIQLCSNHGILIVAEEVQTGFGRTGRWFASEHFGLVPDVLVVGKALGSGMPVSAIVARSELMDHWRPPGHVFCTAANPVCCAAALATLDVLADEGLVQNAAAVGRQMHHDFSELAGRHHAIGDVRGVGLMLGLDLVTDRTSKARAAELARVIVAGCMERGLFLTFLAGSVLRIAPPLCITAREADEAVAILAEVFDEVTAGRTADAGASEFVAGEPGSRPVKKEAVQMSTDDHAGLADLTGPRLEELTEIASELRQTLDALRVTIRIQDQRVLFPVVAEAIVPGARSMLGREMSAAAYAAPTFRYLSETREMLVQDNCLASEHSPPAELVSEYGARSQMLAPMTRDREVIGIISVHSDRIRQWAAREIEALRAGVQRTQSVIAGRG